MKPINLILALLAGFFAAGRGAAMSLDFDTEGAALIENSLVQLRVANRPGGTQGVMGWRFKPTGFEMVDVLYYHMEAGHLAGLRWDGAPIGEIRAGAPAVGDLFVPRLAAITEDGRAIMLRQSTEGDYRLTRTVILRRDHAAIEIRLALENLAAPPRGFGLRLHNVLSPGARGQYQSRQDRIFMLTAAGPLFWDQALSRDAFEERYGSTTLMMTGFESRPATMWTGRGKAAKTTLRAPFAVQLNPENGDGMLLLGDDRLAGFYTAPGMTLEPVFHPVSLQPGERWETSFVIGAFGGAAVEAIHAATPLYLATTPVVHEAGRLQAALQPLFTGVLSVRDGAGKVLAEPAAAPNAPIAVAAAVGDAWQLVALDKSGAEIGRVTSADAGHATLFQPRIVEPARVRPLIASDVAVYRDPSRHDAIRALIAGRDFVVQCDTTAPAAVRELAASAALHLGVGLAETPRYRGRMIAFGSVADSVPIRNAGLLKHSLDARWPGAERGAILYYDAYEGSGEALLVVGGSDAAGALRAARAFHEDCVAPETAAKGFDLWVKPLTAKGMVWDRPKTSPTAARVEIRSARNEYECAQVMLTAYERLTEIAVEATPLAHAESGDPLPAPRSTAARRSHGPLAVRWAQPFPLSDEAGWPGVPDGLLFRQPLAIEAGASRVLWLTTMVEHNTPPGRYTGSLRVTANGATRELPIELTVHDFVLPDNGMGSEAYMTPGLSAPVGASPGSRRAHFQRLVQRLADHRFNMIFLDGFDGLMRRHFSPSGAFKGIDEAGLLANGDGTILLDTSLLDEFIALADSAAGPVKLTFNIRYGDVIGGREALRRAMPDRYAGRPEQDGPGKPDYAARELAELFRDYLERRGLLARVIVKVADEPPGFNHWWDHLAADARAARLPVSTAFNSIDWKQAERALGTVMATFKPLYMRFDPDFAKRAQAAGHKVGWYNCGPPPAHNTGASPSELRSYYWQAARYNLDFVSRYGIQRWGTEGTTPETVWQRRYSHHHSVLYPEHPESPAYRIEGRGWVDQAPVESIRLNLIRDGIEDAEYVRKLRRLIEQARAADRPAAADAAQGVLDGIWRETFPSLSHYNPPYEELLARREQAAQAILALKAALAQN
jgi:hypothetical protein